MKKGRKERKKKLCHEGHEEEKNMKARKERSIKVSNLVFHAQSTSAVISGRRKHERQEEET